MDGGVGLEYVERKEGIIAIDLHPMFIEGNYIIYISREYC